MKQWYRRNSKKVIAYQLAHRSEVAQGESRVCENCGNLLPRGCKKFCSRRCAGESRRKPPRPCVICGKLFTHNNPKIQTCGRSCGAVLGGQKRTADRQPRGHCVICGKPWFKQFGNSKYCSRGCYTEGRRRDSVGNRYHRRSGYVYVRVDRDDPFFSMADVNDLVAEHRLVVARSLGRPLRGRHSDDGYEEVHHINGKRDDNHLENLQLRSNRHGNGQVARCADCGSQHIIFEGLAV